MTIDYTDFITLRNPGHLRDKLSLDELHMVFIGGSITDGFKTPPERRFSGIVQEQFMKKHSCTVHEYNMGNPGVPSIYGLYQTLHEVPGHSPDVIFIEFAINDMKNAEHQAAFESMVSFCTTLPTKPAIILLLARSQVNYTCENYMDMIGEHYQCSSIFLGKAIKSGMDAGTFRWEDYSNDYGHPHDEGHKIIADMILKTFDLALRDQEPALESYLPETAFFDNSLANLHFTGESWVNSSKTHAKAYHLKVTCRSIFLLFDVSPENHYGTALLYIDGKLAEPLSAYRIDSWDHAFSKIIFLGKEPKEHKIKICMEKGEENKDFALLNLGYC